MARKKIKIPPSVVKGLTVLIVVTLIIAGIGAFLFNVFIHADIFKVKLIKIESALSFINRQDIERLKGVSIFQINLNEIQKKLSAKYPQMAEIRVIKEYPDQISIEAKKRYPFLQMRYRNQFIVLDQKGVVLSEIMKMDDKLPLIIGINVNYARIGLAIRSEQLTSALEALRYFILEKSLAGQKIAQIDVANLSEIYIQLSGNLQVKIDRYNIEQKIKLLGFMLSRGDLELSQVKYIDLRFKEPIIGQNEVLMKKNN